MSIESSTMSAPDALRTLLRGNQRFASGLPQHPNQDLVRRQEVAKAQKPFAIIVSCSCSNVPAELIFDQGIGDLYIVRTAGNVVDDIGIGSIEYAAAYWDVQLVLVLGHQNCEIVAAALQGGEAAGHLPAILRRFTPVIEKARTMQGDLAENVASANVSRVVNQLRFNEPVLARLVREGKLKVGGGIYDPDSGKVSLLNE